MNWKRVCKWKKFGGLGVINLRDFNTSLLLKWRKLFDDPTRKWVMLVSHSYCPLTMWWCGRCINKASSSPSWKGVSTVKDIFFSEIAKEVKDERVQEFGTIDGDPPFLWGCFSCNSSLMLSTLQDHSNLPGRRRDGTFRYLI